MNTLPEGEAQKSGIDRDEFRVIVVHFDLVIRNYSKQKRGCLVLFLFVRKWQVERMLKRHSLG